jgi:hypothetical protein
MPSLRTYCRHTIYVGEPSERTLCVVGDIDNDGTPEIVIGARRPRAELYWLGRTPDGDHPHPPAQRIYLNRGAGQFEEHVIDEGIGTHEAKLIVLDGRVGIAGKPYRNVGTEPPRGSDVDCVNLWLPEHA